jgi:hypothetical protein
MTVEEIKSLHGRYFTAAIWLDDVVGRVSVNELGMVYLCQDVYGSTSACRDFLGYKNAWYVKDIEELSESGVFNFKLLPSTDKYHELFTDAIASVKKTWDVDGGYHVIPVEMMTKITEFMTNITEFESKNPGK